MASDTAASVKLCATGLQRRRVLTLKIELMSACVKVFGRRNDGLSTHSRVIASFRGSPNQGLVLLLKLRLRMVPR